MVFYAQTNIIGALASIVTISSKKYVPNLSSLQATCEHNYLHVLKLLPDVDTESLTYDFSAGTGLSYRIEIIDSARYTSTIEIAQTSNHGPDYLKPAMTVRLYHDARMAEVISSQNAGALAPSYSYPNSKMRMRNEKHMVNVFLSEWLVFCLNHRHQPTAQA